VIYIPVNIAVNHSRCLLYTFITIIYMCTSKTVGKYEKSSKTHRAVCNHPSTDVYIYFDFDFLPFVVYNVHTYVIPVIMYTECFALFVFSVYNLPLLLVQYVTLYITVILASISAVPVSY